MKHELFRRYPLVGTAQTSCGAQPVPYHVYDGKVFFMGATADLSAVETLLEKERLYPIRTSNGRALMALWLCDFTEASHGAHHEIQFSIFVARSPQPAVSAYPLAILPLLLTNPEARMLIHGLWNDSPAVVAYNNEILGLGAELAKGRMQHENGRLSFDYAGLLSGEIHTPANTAPQMAFSMLGALGWQGMKAFMAQPYLSTQVVSRIGKFKINATALTFTQYDKVVLQGFDVAQDTLKIQHPVYSQLDLQPTFIEQMQGFKFVYLNPHDVADTALE